MPPIRLLFLNNFALTVKLVPPTFEISYNWQVNSNRILASGTSLKTILFVEVLKVTPSSNSTGVSYIPGFDPPKAG